MIEFDLGTWIPVSLILHDCEGVWWRYIGKHRDLLALLSLCPEIRKLVDYNDISTLQLSPLLFTPKEKRREDPKRSPVQEISGVMQGN